MPLSPTTGLPIQRILFVSTRISGTDGVSLEIAKWTEILEGLGAECYFLTGLSDRPAEKSHVIPEANFLDPTIQEINDQCFGRTSRSREMTSLIQTTAASIKNGIYECAERFQPELIIAENALTLPIHIPLGIALDQFLMETGIPGIAHHHDFVWERQRFVVNSVRDFIAAHFPPRRANLVHVVINSQARAQLGRYAGLSSHVIPNVMDFDRAMPNKPDESGRLRSHLGIGDDELLLLQPTRVVPRKGIEHSIELAKELQERNPKLVITHSRADEGLDYARHLSRFAEHMGVKLIHAAEIVGADENGEQKPCTIAHAYQDADLVTFPSTYEGFGNAFLEAVFHRKPVFCNRYTIFQTDIEPLGFRVPMMNGFLTEKNLEDVKRYIDDEALRNEAVDQNFEIARRHFSYQHATRLLRQIIGNTTAASELWTDA